MSLKSMKSDQIVDFHSEEVRFYLWERDFGTCQYPGCASPGDDPHHIAFRSEQGMDKLNNLVSLCRRHHRSIHDQGYSKKLAEQLRQRVAVNEKELRRRLV